MVESGSYHTFIFQIFLLHDRCKYVYCRYLFIMICTYSFLYQTYSEFLSNSFPIYNLSTSIQNQKNNSQKSTRNKIQALCVYDCSFDIYITSSPNFLMLFTGWLAHPHLIPFHFQWKPSKTNSFPTKENDFQNISAPIHYSLCNLFCNPRICLNSWHVGHSLKTCYQKTSCFCWKVEQRHLSRLSLQRFLRLWETGVRWLLSSVGMLFLSRCLCNFG